MSHQDRLRPYDRASWVIDISISFVVGFVVATAVILCPWWHG